MKRVKTHHGTTIFSCMLGAIMLVAPLCEKAAAQNSPSSTIWLARDDALTRFSTGDLSNTARVEVPGLSVFDIDRINGQLWVAAEAGLYLLNVRGELVAGPVPLPETISDVKILRADANSGGAWLATTDAVAYVDANLQFMPSVTAPSVIVDIHEGSSGEAIALLEGGLYTLTASGEWQLASALSEIKNPRLIEVDRDGKTWIAGKEVLSRLSHGLGSTEMSIPTPLKAPRHLFVDEGVSWVADNHRLVGFDANGQPAYDGRPGKAGIEGNGPRITGLGFDTHLGKPWLSDNHRFFDLMENGAQIAGGAIKALRVYSDLVPPEITILEPEAESYTNNPQREAVIAYSDIGVGVDVDSLAVEFGDVAASVYCNRESGHSTCKPLQPIPDGYHRLTATVEDFVGNLSDEAEVRFTVDTIPPEITLIAPDDGAYTNQPLSLVEGSLSEWAKVNVNMEPVPLSSDLTFEADWLLREGENALHIAAEDRATNEAARTGSVTLDTRAPRLVVTTPADGKLVASRTIVVRGNVDEAATVTVNGETIAVEDNGSFMTDVALSEGTNSIAIQAVDKAGNLANAFRNVIFDATPPAPPDTGLINFSGPDANGQITVTGLPGAAEPGSTVVIVVTSEGGLTVDAEGNPVPLGPNTSEYRAEVNADGSFLLAMPAINEEGVKIYYEDGAGRIGPSVTLDPRELPDHNNTIVGALKGEFSVDPTGAANFRLPIPVPRGAAGMQPDLALLYSSRAGAGQLGVGWSLSGLSAISRCPRNQAIDGVSRGVRFDANDRFCLDGQRLILDDQAATYGARGTRYHTELASFQRVTASGGNTDTGPMYFKVEDKSGLIRWYGKATGKPNGRITLQDSSIAREWLVTRIEDRFHNRIDFTYERQPQEFWLDKIDWYNHTGDWLGQVDFTYSYGRQRTFYTSTGAAMKASQRLASITTSTRAFASTATQSVGTYRLHYKESARTGRDLLQAIEYCPYGSSCLPKTLLEYQENKIKFPNARSYHSYISVEAPHFVDLNKDGKTDPVWHTGNKIKFQIDSAVSTVPFNVSDNVSDRFGFMDANNDGYLDLMVPEGKGNTVFRIHLWDPAEAQFSSDTYVSFRAYASAPETIPVAVDIDGDGRQEIVARAKFRHKIYPVLVVYKFDDDNRLKFHYDGFGVDLKQPLHLTDINADGLPDILLESRECSALLVRPLGDWDGYPPPDDNGSTAPRLSCSDSSGFLFNDGTKFVHAVHGNPMATYDGPPPQIDDGSNDDLPGDDGMSYFEETDGSGHTSEIDLDRYTGSSVTNVNADAICVPDREGLDPVDGDDNDNALLRDPCEPDDDTPIVQDFSWRPSWVKPFDANGDGLTDLLWRQEHNNLLRLILNKGTYWEEAWRLYAHPISEDEFKQAVFAEIDGDGIADLVMVKDGEASYRTGTGTGFSDKHYIEYELDGFIVQDADGDGGTDLVVREDGWKVRFNNGGAVDRLISVIDGYGSETGVLYAALGRRTVGGWRLYGGHLADTDLDTGGGVQQPFMAPLQLVFAFSVDTGTDDRIFTRYHYKGAQIDTGGRGFLGFREVAAYNENSGVETLNRHRQAFPYIGMVEKSEQRIPDQPLASIPPAEVDDIFNLCTRQPWKCQDDMDEGVMQSASNAVTSLAGPRLISRSVAHFTEVPHDAIQFGVLPVVDSMVVESYDYNTGQLLKAETTVNSYGEHGNVTHTETSVTSPSSPTHTIVTDNIYNDSREKWCLGRLETTAVTHAWGDEMNTRESKFEYDMAGHCQLTAEILEPESDYELRTDYVHDTYGNVSSKSVKGHDGVQIVTRTTGTDYDLTGRFVETVTNSEEHEENYVWDARYGVKIEQTGPNGLTTTYEHDKLGRLRATQTPTGEQTEINRAWCVQEACLQPDAAFRVLTTAADGTVIHEYYDRLQRKIATWTTDIGSRRYVALKVYDLRGRVIAVSSTMSADVAQRCWSYIEYDNLDREIARYTPGDTLYCDSASVPTLDEVQGYYASPPAGYRVSRTLYAGLATYTLSPNGRVQSRTVYANGWLASVAEHGKPGALQRNSLPPVLRQDGVDLRVEYFYDAQGNTREVVDPKGNRVVLSYDRLGRKRSMDDPDMGHWEYEYNDFGELISQEDAKGQMVSMQYDALGRMIQRTEPEGITSWTYDTAPGKGIGKLASVVHYDGYAAAYRYDDDGRLQRQVQLLDGNLFEQVFEYDTLGRLTAQHYPALDAKQGEIADVLDRVNSGTSHLAGYSITYQYDKARLKSVTAPDNQILWKLTSLDDGGNIERARFGNGKEEFRRVDIATGELHSLSLGYILGEFSETYQWDGAGNLISRSHSSGQLLDRDIWSETFFYDDLDRLNASELTISTLAQDELLNAPIVEAYAYDVLGNLTRKGAHVSAYQYGTDCDGNVAAPHAVYQVRVNDTERCYQYDANGNIEQSGITRITWSSYNKPLQLQNTQTGSSSEFAYGPDRARYLHRKHHQGKTTTTWQLGSYERIDTGTRTTHRFNIRAGNQVIAVKELDTLNDTALAKHSLIGNATELAEDTVVAHRLNYLHRDHLGSVKLITDSQGNIIERLDYNAWGERRDLKPLQLAAATPALIDDWSADIDYPGAAYQPKRANYHRGYTGHEMLDHLELVHMNGRIYDPVIGRFLSADPFVQFPESTQGFNRYTYVGNNPLSYADPSGYFSLKGFLLGGALGATNPQLAGQIMMAGAPFLNAIPVCVVWCSAVVSAVGGYLVTGDVRTAIHIGGMSAASSGIAIGINAAFTGTTASAVIGRAVASGVAGGLLSEAGGGRFGDGFLGGMAGSLAASGGLANTGNLGTDMTIGAIVGGTVSVIGGGKFANGAVTGAFAAGVRHLRAQKFSARETRYRLGIHSNVSEDADMTDGHAWISLKDNVSGEETLYGLWPDEHPLTENNGPGSDVRINLERGREAVSNAYFDISEDQVALLTDFVNAPAEWSYTHTCADWARDGVYQATGVYLDADDWLGFETPRELTQSINEYNSPGY